MNVTLLRKLCLSLLLSVFAMHFSVAQENTTTPVSVSAESPSHQSLRDLKKAMQDALNNYDLDALLQHTTDNVVFTTMNGDRVIGKAGIRQYFAKMLQGDKPVVKSIQSNFEVESLSHLYGDKVAVAFGHSTDSYELTNGDVWTVKPQWSATVVQQNQQWLIANFHYSVNMFDNPILTAQRQWLLGGGIIVALLTLVLGFFFGRKFRR